MLSLLSFISNFSHASEKSPIPCVINMETIQNDVKIPQKALKKFSESIKNMSCEDNKFILVDFTKSAKEDRFYFFEIEDNQVNLLLKTKVSHGKNSGDLYPTSFSNSTGSKKSSLGLYKINPAENRSHDLASYPLVGLEKTNNNAYVRGITIHDAHYVGDTWAGRSSGCFALSAKDLKYIHENEPEGAYLYAYYH